MSAKRIGTHSGTFHCDEALAVYMLRQTASFKDAPVVRSRDPTVLESLDIVVDVGGVYDPAVHRYDHHQRGFDEHFAPAYNDVKLSSAGLVYRHFGKEVIASVLSWPMDHPSLQLVYERVYEIFVLAVDAIDNGVSAFPADLTPRYRDQTNLGSRVSHLQPWWNEKYSDGILDSLFEKAVTMTGEEFLDRVRYTALAWLPARAIVENALQNRVETDVSGRIIHFKQFCPWKEHLHELEKTVQMTDATRPYFVLYPDGTSGAYRIQAIAVHPTSFETRHPLPAEWRGLRDDVLSHKSGVPGCIFVHAAGFIGGNKSFDGALAMARKAITMS